VSFVMRLSYNKQCHRLKCKRVIRKCSIHHREVCQFSTLINWWGWILLSSVLLHGFISEPKFIKFFFYCSHQFFSRLTSFLSALILQFRSNFYFSISILFTTVHGEICTVKLKRCLKAPARFLQQNRTKRRQLLSQPLVHRGGFHHFHVDQSTLSRKPVLQ